MFLMPANKAQTKHQFETIYQLDDHKVPDISLYLPVVQIPWDRLDVAKKNLDNITYFCKD